MSPPAVEIRVPTPADLDYLAEHLADADRAELAACGFADMRQALEHSQAHSRQTFVGHIDQVPVAIFGCGEYGSLLAPTGVPWLLGTEALRRHRRVLQRVARRYIEVMLEQYPRLVNVVHADNVRAIDWLRRLGFRVSEQVHTSAHTGAPFHLFEMSRHV